jgi:HAD superfamily hydrolase (TIGR01509 family)
VIFPQAFFFDMDGLSVDTEPLWLQTEIELANEYGADWSLADQAHCLGGPMSKVGIHLANKTNRPDLAEWFSEEMVSRMAKRCVTGVGFMPGVESLLDEITSLDIPIALVSASPRPIVDAVLNGLSKNFYRFSISASDVTRSKPFPDPYLVAARKFNVEISECIVLEDSVTGVASGTAAGAYVVAVPHLVPIEEAPRRLILKSLDNVSVSFLVEKFNR